MILFPNAKINLGLNVVERRFDGYHNLESVFFPIPFCDALEVLVHSGDEEYVFSSSGLPILGDAKNNLVVKALGLLKQDYTLPSVKIHLHKSIPMGAGLGGGSADGAFMLRLLNEMFDLNIDKEVLKRYALKLGADCPFFIENMPSYVTGIGENIKTIDFSLSGYYFVLLNPEIHISTPVAFSNIKPRSPLVNVCDVLRLPIECWRDKLINDFEASVFPSNPLIEQQKKSLYEDGALYASMTGSGSSVYGIFTSLPPKITHHSYLVWQGFI